MAAYHPSWVFEKSVASVSLRRDSGQAEDIIIAGYDVKDEVEQVGVSVLSGANQLGAGQTPDNTKTEAAVSGIVTSGAKDSPVGGAEVKLQSERSSVTATSDQSGQSVPIVSPEIKRGEVMMGTKDEEDDEDDEEGKKEEHC